MYFDPECISCIISQANRSAKLFINGNKEAHLKLLKDVCEKVKIIDQNFTAPHFSLIIQELIEKTTNTNDPYKSIKEKNLKDAKMFIPAMEKLIENATDKLEAALKIAILGNTIDVGANPNFDLDSDFDLLKFASLNLTEFEQFSEDIKNADSILYIGDNYEEALFDKFLLTELSNKNLVFAVRSRPILNDITIEDAEHLGINKICKVIESGSKIAGTDINKCSPEFLEMYNNADVVISKGQGNFETLLDESRPIYFLFKVKCEVIALRSGLNKGEGALLYHQNGKWSKNENL